MNVRSPRLNFSVATTALVMACAGSASAQGTALKVFVYNGGNDNMGTPGDTFNSAAQGWIFQQMGLLGPHGEPPTLSGDNLLDPQSQIVGTVIRDGANAIIGVKSLDGSMRAYNVDTSATTGDAWNAVSAAGDLVIAKHGVTGGGAICLDNGTQYSGFRPTLPPPPPEGGTGVPTPGGPYSLPGRAGANIVVDVNGCFSSLDPDGPQGPQKSVTDTLRGIPGVMNATGHAGVVYKGALITLFGTARQRALAKTRLNDCAKQAGFKDNTGSGDAGSWVNAQPFPRQWSSARDCIAGTGAQVSLSYDKGEDPNAAAGAGYYAPVTIMGGSGGQVHYQASPDRPSILLDVPPGSLGGLNPVFVRPRSLTTPLPAGTEPATLATSVGNYGLSPAIQFGIPAVLTLTYPTAEQVTGFFEVLTDGTLAPQSAQIGGGQIVSTLQHGGVFVALMPEQPSATGACCFPDNTCAVVLSGACTDVGGVYRGDGTSCAASCPSPCYPNCDASTAPPILNVADFTCFLQKYASQDPYANCDGSTTAPTLNVADFTCFLQKYAAGCQ